MAQLSLREGARQLGLSRQTLYRYAAKGRLSVTIDAAGNKTVDTSELLRVFGRLEPARQSPAVTGDSHQLHQATAPATGDDRAVLAAELAAAREALKRAEQQIDEAREREAKLLELLSRQTLLLEHKTTPKKRRRKKTVDEPKVKASKKRRKKTVSSR